MTTNNPVSLGKYQIQRLLGKGAFAHVFEALDTTLQRAVALKVLDPNWVSETFVAGFIREAQTAAKLQGDHIVHIYEIGEVDGRYYIAMQFIPGGTLAKALLEGARPPTQTAARIIAEVADALDIAHRSGITHRDVKPSNILLDDKGRAYLSDFGIARAISSDSAATMSGIATGTAAYFSPEQAKGKPLDSRSDVYSLAVVAYELLVGRLPFESENVYGFIQQHASEAPAPPSTLNPQISQAVQDVLLKALSKDPVARYPRARVFAAELKKAIAEPFQPVSVLPPVETKTSEESIMVAKLDSPPAAVPARPVALRSNAPRPTFKRRSSSRWISVGAIVLAMLLVCFIGAGILIRPWLQGILFPEQAALVAANTALSAIGTPLPDTTQPLSMALTPAFTSTHTSTATYTPTRVSPTPTETLTPTASPTSTDTPTPSVVLPFSDDFDRGIRPEWDFLSVGNWRTIDGKLTVTDSARQWAYLLLEEPSWTNYIVELDYSTNTNDAVAVLVRIKNTGNLGLAFIEGASHNAWSIWRDGEWKDLAEKDKKDWTYEGHIRVEVTGSTFVGYSNVTQLAITDNSTSNGFVGLGIYCGIDTNCPTIDNVIIEPINP